MTHNSFKKANKSAVYLKLAITGPRGSGKTTAALRLARGLVGDNGRIAVIDTENSSSLLYADTFDFDVCVVEPPYTEDKFITAIADAVEGKYDCVIIDSFSHVWQAENLKAFCRRCFRRNSTSYVVCARRWTTQ